MSALASPPRTPAGPLGSTLARLDDQLAWYERKASWNQRRYRYASVVEIAISSVIMIVASMRDPVFFGPIGLAAGLAAVLAVTKGMETVFQWRTTWVSYRAAVQALSREKYLFLAGAGPYAGTARPEQLLAERVEDILGHESGGWTDRMTQPPPAGEHPAAPAS